MCLNTIFLSVRKVCVYMYVYIICNITLMHYYRNLILGTWFIA